MTKLTKEDEADIIIDRLKTTPEERDIRALNEFLEALKSSPTQVLDSIHFAKLIDNFRIPPAEKP